MLKTKRKLLIIIFLMYFLAPQGTSAVSTHFPCPDEIIPHVQFWEKIYSQYTTDEGLLHDSNDLTIIYEVINIKDIKGSRRKEQRLIKKKKNKYKHILNSIISKKGINLSPEEQRIYNLFADKSMGVFKQARHTMRFQVGQKDRFIKGVQLSYRYLNHIKKIIDEMGAPQELMYLPHVESSFNYKAYSKFGAAGIWQFTRNTGKMYMKINYVYDERLDPIKSTCAAIKYLLASYKKLNSWPLALISYNHGQTGMRKAVKRLGTNDFLHIINNYKSRTFGFASRNFYFEFLAAWKVAKNYKHYFGDIPVEDDLAYQTYCLKDKVLLKDICAHTGLHRKIIQKFNPALRNPALLSHRYIPKDYVLNLPVDKDYKLDEFFDNFKPSQATMVASLDITPIKKKTSKLHNNIINKKEKLKEEQRIKKQENMAEINSGIDEGRWADSMYRDEYKFIRIEYPYVWLKVHIDETIGHYAEWAGIRASEIRELNNMEIYSSHLKVGKIIKLRLHNVTTEEFKESRIDYHKGIEEDFFDNFTVDSIFEYEVQRGDNLWTLCMEKFDVPHWLLERFNHHIDFDNLMPLTRIVVPAIIEKALYL
ncbi:MAG: transglycosylase SLT domain-containing protein [bacterium]